MPRLACIIPALGNTESLETTLVSVLERRPDDCEVLVVLNAPYEDPYNLQGEIQFLQAPAKTDLISCLNLGISATQAPIVHLLASGSQVDEGWIERALAHFDDPRVAAVTPAIYHTGDNNKLLAAGVGYRCGGQKMICQVSPEANDKPSLHCVGPLLQAAFVRKKALDAFGGLPTGLGDALGDIDLALSLRHAGWRIALEPNCRIFAPAIEVPQAHGFLGGFWAERLFWRHASELGWLGSVLAHPATVLRDAIPSHILGRLIAVFQTGHYRRYRQVLAAAQVEAAAAESAWRDQQRQTAATHTSPPDGQRLRVDIAHQAAVPAEKRQAAPARRQKNRR